MGRGSLPQGCTILPRITGGMSWVTLSGNCISSSIIMNKQLLSWCEAYAVNLHAVTVTCTNSDFQGIGFALR